MKTVLGQVMGLTSRGSIRARVTVGAKKATEPDSVTFGIVD